MSALIVKLEEDQLQDLAARIAAILSPEQKRPYTLAEASKAIGISRQAIRNQIEAGTIAKVPATGRRVLIPRAEVERIQSGRKRQQPLTPTR